MRFTQEELGILVQNFRRETRIALEQPVTEVQRRTTFDRGARGPQWVSRTVFPAPPENDARSMLLAAISKLGDGNERYEIPTVAPVPAQWVGFRSGVAKDAPEPQMTEQAKFDALMKEASSDMTIMYMYGGGFYMNGPAVRRTTTTILSQLTTACCIIIQPRVSPQSPFPSQILDTLHAYLSLLYPPAGSFHQPINPRKLVFAGDSSGGQLALGVIQVILSSQRHYGDVPALRFHGQEVSVPLPAGIAIQSPAIGVHLPSYEANAHTDVMPIEMPYRFAQFPSDSVWPTNPPREGLYGHLESYMNSLIAPMLATRWTGAPPMYFAVGGGEIFKDSAAVVAQTAARQDVPVVWDEYELMPHNWPMIIPEWPQSTLCMKRWAEACTIFTSSQPPISSAGTIHHFATDREGERKAEKVDVLRLNMFREQDVKAVMKRGIRELRELVARSKEQLKGRL